MILLLVLVHALTQLKLLKILTILILVKLEKLIICRVKHMSEKNLNLIMTSIFSLSAWEDENNTGSSSKILPMNYYQESVNRSETFDKDVYLLMGENGLLGSTIDGYVVLE